MFSVLIGFAPDLNPIEHLRDILDRRVRRRDREPAAVLQLRQALQEEWDRITQVEILQLIDSMHHRIQAVCDARRDHTRY